MKRLHVLFIGNSFSQNTSEFLAAFALGLGVEDVKVGTLYIGGCSVNMHLNHFENATHNYEYYVNVGEGNVLTPNTSINDAVDSDEWDIIAIQSGTGDGSRLTDPFAYHSVEKLATLVKAAAKGSPKILFCMTWVGESCHSQAEIRAFDGNTALIYAIMREIVRHYVSRLPVIDGIVPGGTAVENARRRFPSERLSLDRYHMSAVAGQALLALNFLANATDLDVTAATWWPEGLSDSEKADLLACVKAAKENPYEITVL
jgi:hypothetical protein